ncbi:MG2 domain-containing protein [Olivibacter ginsenosidimutans]|uniref:MG2 domain-containing protein n=1 Tax=Olivibacter ginsenosidimutans TaxID=1176537 RepID=A0ABP9BCA1_9SPHI
MKSIKYLLFSFVLLTFSCGKKNAKEFNSDFSLYKDYITAFTSGMVSAESDIRVVLAFNKKEWKPNQELDADLFSISPKTPGKVIALSQNTVIFKPAKRLKQDTEYQITLHLDDLIDVSKKLSTFNFTVKTIKQDFVVLTREIQSYNKDYQFLHAVLRTSDNLDAKSAAKLVAAEQNGKQLPIRFDEATAGSEFQFIVDSIKRPDADSKIKLAWNGSSLDIDQKGSETVEIAAKGNFKVMKATVAEENSQLLLINFSDPLKKNQNFEGLVTIDSAKNLTYAVDGNVLKVFVNEELKGERLVEVFQGIESTDGLKLKKGYAKKLVFEQTKPGVRMLKNGTLLPSSNNLKINFEAANLKAVDVKVYKIYENNVLQFLQDNDINGNYNLRKVALPVAKKKIELTQNRLYNNGKWNVFALDLAELIKPDPGAIYHIEFSYKKAYSIYPCAVKPESDTAEDTNDETTLEEDQDNARGNIGDDYTYYDDYDWRERDDPCSNSYYYYDNKVSTNVLATDLGVIAKMGKNNSYFFAVNNIVDTKPVAGAQVSLYDYQQQKVGEATTKEDGTATFDNTKRGYFVIVKKDKQTSYIKLEEGLSLSLSNFDVSGNELEKGLKGFIYGERGVWRPGDTLFLSFMLNDQANPLPPTHPVKLRLTDPNGKLVTQQVQKYREGHHYSFVIPTKADAPTGNWEAMVSVGGARFYKSIKIETIKPNRLKIKNKLAGKVLRALAATTDQIEVMWLHGAVAKNLKAEMQAKFYQMKTTFKGFNNYTFDDPARKFSTEEVNVFSGNIDEAGKATVGIKPQLHGQAPGMLKASFITKVYEEGGDFSTDIASATYSPYQTYVGLKSPEPNKYGMLETGKVNRFDIVTLNENGQAKATPNLDVRVYKVDWRWWWDASDDNLSNYSASSSKTPYKSFRVSTGANGKTSIQFTVDENDWGRYFVQVTDLDGGHATGETVLIDWPYWSAKTKNTDGTNANMLVFSTDKSKYNVGEKMNVSFPSSEGSRALVSIESGSQVVATYWVETKKGETQLEVPVTAKMAPNVYVFITLLQPHASTLNDAPIRLYGVVPVEVLDKETILEPVLNMPDVLRPEQSFSLQVKEKKGRSMTYTIAVVDEGLLDLTRFKTPNAWDKFYAREALGVKTWDVYNDVIGAYGGKVNQVFSIGGDEDMGGGENKNADRFKPVVIYLGPFTLDKGGSNSHQIKLPNYIGSVRTMVVAGDAPTSAYGSAEKATPVRSPLMVLASLPRKISPTEKVTLPVTVFAMENQVKQAQVQVKTSSGIKVLGNATKTVDFSQPEEKMVYFDLEVGNTTGIGKIEVLATSGKEKASYPVEIAITNPNPVTNDYKELVLKAGEEGAINWNTFGVSGSNQSRLEVSSFPAINLNSRLNYLIQYPHGCLEQTTSGVFPQLYLNDVVDLDKAKQEAIQRNVVEGINKLAGFQLNNGGFVYWPGLSVADDWSTSYAGHFMIEAETKGYVLPVDFKTKWIAYQQKAAKEWRMESYRGSDFAQAYRLYTLALAGSPDLASMNRLRETVGISNETRLRLAAAYALAGQKNAGNELLNQSTIDNQNNAYSYYYYGSPERNRAMALETLLLLNQTAKAFPIATYVAKDLSSGMWMSTQTTAYSLYAVSKFAKTNGKAGVHVQYAYQGKNEEVKTGKAFADRPLAVKMGANTIKVKNNDKNTIYVRVLNSGILPVGEEQVIQRNLSANLQFQDRKGNPLTINALHQGTEFVALVTVKNQSLDRVENIALTQIIPSGWEIVNTRYTDYGDFGKNVADYIDIRDDRTSFYFGLNGSESRTFKILLNASYLGRYYLPGVQCEAMYDHSFLVRTKGEWIEVVK